MTVNDPYLSPSQGSDGSDASPPAEEAACGRGGSGGQRTERPSSASSSSFDSTGTTLQGTPTLDYEQEPGWYVDSTGAAVHHNPTLTHNAETIETHDHRIARRDFVETPADNDERANLLNRLEQLPSNEIPDDLPMASPSPGHLQHNIRSTSHGTITYSPRRRRHTEHAATAVPAVHPAHRVSRFHKGEPSNESPPDVQSQAPPSWRMITQPSNPPLIPPRSPLRPPFRQPFLSLSESYFPPPTLTSTSEPIAPDPATSPVSATVHRDILSMAMRGPLDSNNITPDSVGSPLMMAPFVRGAGRGSGNANGEAEGTSPAAFLASRGLPTGGSMTSSSKESPLMMAPYVRGGGSSTTGYPAARGPSPAALTARLEVAQRTRPESEPSPISNGPASPLSGAGVSPLPAANQSQSRASPLPPVRASLLPIANQTRIAGSIAEVGRQLRSLEDRSNSIRRNIPLAFPHWYDVPQPDAIYVRNERTLGPAAPLGNTFPLNTQIDNTVPEDAVSNPSPPDPDLSDPELPDMSTITPHLTPPPPAPAGPPPDPINFASCEERNDWVAEQYRAFTTTITTELFGLENALRGLRALRDLGGEHARRTVQQAHLVREGLERLEES